MKLTRYPFEKSLQEATADSREWLREEYKRILESDKDYTAKCDYIGYSILSIDEKIAVLDEQIKEMQALKSHLKSAKEIAVEIGAEVFQSYGIAKIEGAGISSITFTGEKHTDKPFLEVLNPDEAMARGFVSITVDTEALIKELQTLESKYSLLGIAQLKMQTTITPPRIKVNRRRKKEEDRDPLDLEADQKEAA